MGKALRTIYVELPAEDLEKYGSDKVGLLLRSMYGTQDASNIWQWDYVQLFCGEEGTFARGRHNAAIFYSEHHDARLLVHGDDFIPLADEDGLAHVDVLLSSKYTVKNLGTVGFERGDSRELCRSKISDPGRPHAIHGLTCRNRRYSS